MQEDPNGTSAAGTVVTKYVCQHSKELPKETMDFLRGIAADYAKVKTAVYERYSGIRKMSRLTPVYTVQKEMRACGLRKQLDLPVVYYELAVTEAVGNIKSMWERTKDKVREAIRERDNLSPEERMYIRTVLKLESILAAILNRRPYEMPHKMAGIEIDVSRLNNLICRLVRQYRIKPCIRNADQFKVTPAGYRYRDGGIYLVSRIPRNRIYLPLKDTQAWSRQIRVNLSEHSAELHIPVDVRVRGRDDYGGSIYAYIGYRDAVTLSNGHIYGKDLERLVSPETERLNAKNAERNKLRVICEKTMAAGNSDEARRIALNNLGKKKYDAQRMRMRERTQNYINAELNRMIAEEKPGCIVVTKPVTKRRTKFYDKKVNRKYARSFYGYIRRRLAEKCRVRGIALVEIGFADTKRICSACGSEGLCDREGFHCPACGYHATVAQNAARNIEKKALTAGTKAD